MIFTYVNPLSTLSDMSALDALWLAARTIIALAVLTLFAFLVLLMCAYVAGRHDRIRKQRRRGKAELEATRPVTALVVDPADGWGDVQDVQQLKSQAVRLVEPDTAWSDPSVQMLARSARYTRITGNLVRGPWGQVDFGTTDSGDENDRDNRDGRNGGGAA